MDNVLFADAEWAITWRRINKHRKLYQLIFVRRVTNYFMTQTTSGNANRTQHSKIITSRHTEKKPRYFAR